MMWLMILLQEGLAWIPETTVMPWMLLCLFALATVVGKVVAWLRRLDQGLLEVTETLRQFQEVRSLLERPPTPVDNGVLLEPASFLQTATQDLLAATKTEWRTNRKILNDRLRIIMEQHQELLSVLALLKRNTQSLQVHFPETLREMANHLAIVRESFDSMTDREHNLYEEHTQAVISTFHALESRIHALNKTVQSWKQPQTGNAQSPEQMAQSLNAKVSYVSEELGDVRQAVDEIASALGIQSTRAPRPPPPPWQ